MKHFRFCLACVSLFWISTVWSCTDIPATECEALTALYQNTQGDNWTHREGWLTAPLAADWQGVTVTAGRVTAVRLPDNQLVGTIPQTLCQLPELRYLDLSNNEELTGTVPTCHSQLRTLNLSNLQLTGPLPPALCQLTQLQALWLQGNQLTGTLPTCLGTLNQLNILWIYNNQLTGTLPAEWCNLTQLEYLGVGRNQLSGAIPACLGNLTQLQILYLSYNSFTGLLPATFANFVNLRQLYFDNNKLVGPLPEAFVSLALTNPQLIQLHLQRNNFNSGECAPVQRLIARGGWQENVPGWFDGGFEHSPQGGISDFVAYCPPLAPVLTVSQVGEGSVTGPGIECGADCTENYEPNAQVTLTANPGVGFIFTVWGGQCQGNEVTTTVKMDAHKTCIAHFARPPAFACAEVAQNECDALVAFYLKTGGASWTKNTGWLTETSVSKWLGVTVQNGFVTKIDLKNNKLVGKFPLEICQLTHLQQLSLGEYQGTTNQLFGEIPTCLENLKELKFLSLASNEFTGPIPLALGKLSNLTYLDLRDNPIEGTIPEAICELTQLESLYLGTDIIKRNNIEIGRLNSKLTGAIPSCMGDKLVNLKNLSLEQAKFTGEIPTSLCNLNNLQSLGLANTFGLTGLIPTCLGNLMNLNSLWLHGNKLTGNIPSELCSLSQLQNLSLYDNQLTGEIPQCLGNLTKLGVLYFHSNKLTGEIPPELCNLVNLNNLSFGYNQMTGEIPECLGNLVKLKILSLSGNTFTGKLPNSFKNLLLLRQLYFDNNQLYGPLPEEFVNMAFTSPNLIQLNLSNNHFGLEECRPIQILRTKTNWVKRNLDWGAGIGGFIHSPQQSGLDFEVDCAPYALYVLTATKTGNGTVTGEGIDCGNDCIDAYATNAQLTLTANPHADSQFTSWSGDCQGSDPMTTVIMDADKSCQATFTLRPICERVTDVPREECEALQTLYATTGGTNWRHQAGWLTETSVANWWGIQVSAGHVTAVKLADNQLTGPLPQAFIDFALNNSSLVQLNLSQNQLGEEDCATIQTLSQRGGWNEFQHSPQGSGFDFNKDCFFKLTITITGNGRVIGKRLNCEEDECTQAYDSNTLVELTAFPTEESQFIGWGGDCSGRDTPFPLTMTRDYTCTAHFEPLPFACDRVTDVPKTECAALQAIYETTDGSHWSNPAGWLFDKVVVNWAGVSVAEGHVTQLELVSQNLVGPVPKAICQLLHLRSLDLSWNALTGMLPKCLGEQLTRLQSLSLANLQLTGTLPSSLQNLAQLQYLDVSNNQFQGPLVEAVTAGWVTNEQLVQLNLDHNHFAATECPAIQALMERGGWSLKHSPQQDGFDFNMDCIDVTLPSLTVTKLGGGRGVVKGRLLTCDAACSKATQNYAPNSQIKLKAVPSKGFQFKGWGQDCQGSQMTSSVVMNTLTKHCSAEFVPTTEATQLTVVVTGPGTVTAPWLSCDDQCSAYYPRDQKVKLVATPQPNALFMGWEGDCRGLKPSFKVTLDTAKQCTAHFQFHNPDDIFTLTVQKAGTGRGSVRARWVGEKEASLVCRPLCQTHHVKYASGKHVMVTARPAEGFSFVGWEGDCSGFEPRWQFIMTENKNCTARFVVDPSQLVYKLTMTLQGTGTVRGLQWSSESCLGSCVIYYPAGRKVWLSANREAQWSGDCVGRRQWAHLVMTQDQSCTVLFKSGP